jgi:hypothetical protein
MRSHHQSDYSECDANHQSSAPSEQCHVLDEPTGCAWEVHQTKLCALGCHCGDGDGDDGGGDAVHAEQLQEQAQAAQTATSSVLLPSITQNKLLELRFSTQNTNIQQKRPLCQKGVFRFATMFGASFLDDHRIRSWPDEGDSDSEHSLTDAERILNSISRFDIPATICRWLGIVLPSLPEDEAESEDGSDHDAEQKIDDDFFCPICLQLLYNPLVTSYARARARFPLAKQILGFFFKSFSFNFLYLPKSNKLFLKSFAIIYFAAAATRSALVAYTPRILKKLSALSVAAICPPFPHPQQYTQSFATSSFARIQTSTSAGPILKSCNFHKLSVNPSRHQKILTQKAKIWMMICW